MLHVKIQDHRTSGSGEEDFKIFTIYMVLPYVPYMGMAAIQQLGHVTWII